MNKKLSVILFFSVLLLDWVWAEYFISRDLFPTFIVVLSTVIWLLLNLFSINFLVKQFSK